MNIGASTANLYPMRTEEALDQLLRLGFQTIEVFANTESEVEPSFAQELRRKADDHGAHIVAVHPYTSGIEPYLLFSAYERRFEDGLQHYSRIYEAAAVMGASYVILHGDKIGGVLNEDDTLARYERLFDLGKSKGLTLLQENVVTYRASEIAFIQTMRRLLGEKALFTFDIKQCRRSGLEPSAVIQAMGKGLLHVHISDQDDDKDCLIPGRGTMNFKKLIENLKSAGFSGNLILELYRSNYHSVKELMGGYQFLSELINS